MKHIFCVANVQSPLAAGAPAAPALVGSVDSASAAAPSPAAGTYPTRYQSCLKASTKLTYYITQPLDGAALTQFSFVISGTSPTTFGTAAGTTSTDRVGGQILPLTGTLTAMSMSGIANLVSQEALATGAGTLADSSDITINSCKTTQSGASLAESVVCTKAGSTLALPLCWGGGPGGVAVTRLEACYSSELSCWLRFAGW